jgi:ATP-dependent RNA helicase RhlE
MLFNELNLLEPILRALQEEGYQKPTPIQEQAIPIVLNGADLLGCAQTGTGKTAAFSIPILQILNKQALPASAHRPIRCLILTPTRELAIQIGDSIQAYGRHLPLRHTVIFGGVGQKPQTDALRRGVDILVATPGRLIDLINQGFISLNSLSIFVLDEADRMLDMGFVHDVKRILTRIPEHRQSLFFSATMPPEIQKLASTILKNPQKVEVAPVSSTADTIQQEVFFVDKDKKRGLLDAMLKKRMGRESVLVFTRTKHGADRVVKDLVRLGHTAEAIHGNKAQNARQRALANFKSGQTRVLVATDIAARGIDIDSLAFVLNYDLPNVPETYVHRIGRTGRAGQNGTSFSFCMEEEIPYLRDIQKLIRKSIPVTEAAPWTYQTPSLEPKVHGHAQRDSSKPKPQGNNARKSYHGRNNRRPSNKTANSN